MAPLNTTTGTSMDPVTNNSASSDETGAARENMNNTEISNGSAAAISPVPSSPVSTSAEASEKMTTTSTTRSLRLAGSSSDVSGRGRNGGGSPNAVLFSTSSRYHPIVWATLAIAPLTILLAMYMVRTARYNASEENDYDDNDDYFAQPMAKEKIRQHWILVWTMITVFCLYMVVLPKQVDVRYNGSIGVKTVLLTFQFPFAARAYLTEGSCLGGEELLRPGLKFATDPWSRVVVVRRFGKFDITLSPKDAHGFIEAIEKVVGQNEGTSRRDDSSRHNDVESKPDLASS